MLQLGVCDWLRECHPVGRLSFLLASQLCEEALFHVLGYDSVFYITDNLRTTMCFFFLLNKKDYFHSSHFD